MKKLFMGVVGIAVAIGLAACSSDATVVSQNLSTAADNFEIPRRVVLYNGITDAYIQTVEGYCSLGPSTTGDVAVTCKTSTGYVKHIWTLGDNVTVFSEQLLDADVSTQHYRVLFKPSEIIPSIGLN